MEGSTLQLTRDLGHPVSVYNEISRVENALRDLIADVLAAEHGDLWEKHLGVTENRRAIWEDRRDEERKKLVGGVVEDRLLYYADFHDLKAIIKKHWQLLRPCFRNQQRLLVYLDRLGDLRNPGAHSRRILPFEEHLIAGMAGELVQEIAMFRDEGGGGPEPEHFARIVEVYDSFGHRGTGRASNNPIYDTGLTLRPGQRLVFRATAVDPSGRLLRWRVALIAEGRSDVVLAEDEGSNLEVVWEIAEADIHDRQEVRFHLSSATGFHRFGIFDDTFDLWYRVLPNR